MSRIVPFLLLAIACGSSDDPTDRTDVADTDTVDDTGDTTDTDTVSVDITAAEGGDVASGEATLSIPPGALAEDTTITVSETVAAGLPDAGTIASVVWDFGPDGLQFLTPATLEVEVGSAAPNGKAHVLSWYDEATSAWVDLPSSVDGLVVSASVDHFTMYAVRVIDAPNIDVCELVDPCGGDVVGTWSLLGICFVSETPPLPECPTSTLDMVIDANGGWDFASNQTYTYDITLSAILTMTIPPECIPPIPRFTCAVFDSDAMTCTGDETTGCTCTGATPSTNEAGAGTWTMDGDVLVTDEGGTIDRSPICVAGDVLRAMDPEDGTMLTFQR